MQSSSAVSTEGPGEPLAAPVRAAEELAFATADLGAIRRAVGGWAEQQGLGPEATEELVLAVNELTTNSIRYGGGRGVLLRWREPDALACEIRDHGHIDDPLAGTQRPTADAHSGRGLWLVRQLCDRVEIDSSPQGTSVRVCKRLPNS